MVSTLCYEARTTSTLLLLRVRRATVDGGKYNVCVCVCVSLRCAEVFARHEYGVMVVLLCGVCPVSGTS